MSSPEDWRSSGRPATVGRHRALVGFGAFGWFWGTFGASLPAIKAQADVSEGAFGIALLCIGVGALATMRPMGALVDRHGRRLLPASMLVFAGTALLPGAARSALVLGAALLLLGAASGAVDVAINAEAVRTEASGRPLLNLAHALFSAGVVGASLLTGVLSSLDADLVVLLGATSAALAASAILLHRLEAAPRPPSVSMRRTGGPLRIPRPLAILGGLCAIAYLVENAWQSWSAVHLQETLDATAAVASLGPALFAASALTGRLLGQPLASRVSDRALLAGGAGVAASGTLLGATADRSGLALLGIGLAGLGTSVCAPTLISLAGRIAAPERRGSAVSIVTTIAYLGFLVGPAAVGLAAAASTLTTALAGVAALAALLAVGARIAPVPEHD
ncbi:MAG: MFS transporter [Gaiellaceae bacterium MAG52_C11]|nr:MFS transporter [Candidatus Gaiellasilicea maunaloa]